MNGDIRTSEYCALLRIIVRVSISHLKYCNKYTLQKAASFYRPQWPLESFFILAVKTPFLNLCCTYQHFPLVTAYTISNQYTGNQCFIVRDSMTGVLPSVSKQIHRNTHSSTYYHHSPQHKRCFETRSFLHVNLEFKICKHPQTRLVLRAL